MVTLLYQTLQLMLGYGMVIWRTWLMAAGKNLISTFKIEAKPPYIETWLLLSYYWQTMWTLVVVF